MPDMLKPLAMLTAALVLAGCEWPSMETTQLGFRGTAMEQVTNPRIVAGRASLHDVPEPLPAAAAAGPKAGAIYQNVQVLGDLSPAGAVLMPDYRCRLEERAPACLEAKVQILGHLESRVKSVQPQKVLPRDQQVGAREEGSSLSNVSRQEV